MVRNAEIWIDNTAESWNQWGQQNSQAQKLNFTCLKLQPKNEVLRSKWISQVETQKKIEIEKGNWICIPPSLSHLQLWFFLHSYDMIDPYLYSMPRNSSTSTFKNGSQPQSCCLSHPFSPQSHNSHFLISNFPLDYIYIIITCTMYYF